jgi:citrate lyase subunit beta / citryl-CoA lyase
VMNDTLNFVVPLFVPASRTERFAKAAASGADAVILDLEDAVAPEAKSLARSYLRTDFTSLPIVVRVNALGTPWYADDLAAVRNVQAAAVMLPKVECPDALASAFELLGGSTPIIALVETARGIANCRQIAASSSVVRLAFGSIDFCADVGCAHTPEALLSARSEIVLASRLAELHAPLDGVTAAISDGEAARHDARHALNLGFGGKLCIHPNQIEHVLLGFRPDENEIAWARKVLTSGDGAVAVDGAMVDEPVRRRARAVLKRSGYKNSET